MKKIFGVLLLFIGLFLVALGMFGMGNTSGRRNCNDSQIEMNQEYNPNKDSDLAIGGSIATVGLVFHIIGIVLLVTKTKKQLLLETELEILKNRK